MRNLKLKCEVTPTDDLLITTRCDGEVIIKISDHHTGEYETIVLSPRKVAKLKKWCDEYLESRNK
jgi:hypothetical protein